MSLISAHRCRMACELAELETIPMIIRNLEDNEAIIIMTDFKQAEGESAAQ